MTIIKIFLASSIEEFKDEREEFRSFILSLNNIYVKRGIYFELITCDDFSDAIISGGKQNEYNKVIPECKYFYILIGHDLGKYTLEEFNVADEAYRQSGSQQPKIFTYFYELSEKESPMKSVTDFMDRLDSNLNHYYNTFSNLDTIKLKFLVEISRDNELSGELSIKEGVAVFEGEQVLELKNTPIYSNNSTISELRAKADELNIRFAESVKRYSENQNNSKEYITLLHISEERTRIFDELRKTEAGLLDLCYKISKSEQSGQNTWREREASILLEKGNYDAALTLLRDAQRDKELQQAELLLDTGLNIVEGHIRENILKITTLNAKGINDDTLSEIIECYDESFELAIKHNICGKIIYDYIEFFESVGLYAKVTARLNQIQDMYISNDFNNEKLAKIYNLIARSFAFGHDISHAKFYFNKAFEMYDKVTETNEKIWNMYTCNKILMDLSIIDNDLNNAERYFKNANEYIKKYSCRDFFKARVSITLFNQAIIISKKRNNIELVEKYDAMVEENLHILSNSSYYEDKSFVEISLGNKMIKKGEYENAITHYKLGLDIINKNVKDGIKKEKSQIEFYKNIGKAYKAQRKYKEALPFLEKAVNIYRHLSIYEPLGNKLFLAEAIDSLADCQESLFYYDDAVHNYREYIILNKELIGRDDGYEAFIAYGNRRLASLLKDLNEFAEAEDVFRDAVNILEKDVSDDERYLAQFSDTLLEFAWLLCDLGNSYYQEAERMVYKAIDIEKKLLQDNTNRTERNIAWAYNTLASLYKGYKDFDKAFEMQNKALLIFEKLSNENFEKWKLELSKVLHNLSWLENERYMYDGTEYPKDISEHLQKELNIREELAESGKDVNGLLASTYFEYGRYCNCIANFKDACCYFEKALDIYNGIYKICPKAFSANMASLFCQYAKSLKNLDRREDAENYSKQSVDIYRNLMDKAPDVYRTNAAEAFKIYIDIIEKN